MPRRGQLDGRKVGNPVILAQIGFAGLVLATPAWTGKVTSRQFIFQRISIVGSGAVWNDDPESLNHEAR
jgi:hypothetical protein